ncbi:flagellar brake protein [Candidatus Sumerlaeota bacterium]|nr:flagellar brake protein [Candidatus Sumerlaeota bacterium]
MRKESITGREQIVSHLGDLIQAQTRVTVTLGQGKTEYLSQILSLTPEGDRGTAELDELAPRGGQRRARSEKSLRCLYRHRRLPYVFRTDILEVRDDPQPAIIISLPDRIAFNQNRRHYRVEPFSSCPIQCRLLEIPSLEMSPVMVAKRCEVVDISLGGISLSLDVPRSHLSPGTVLPRISLILPSGEEILAQIIIRTVRRMESARRPYRIGAEFFLLDDRTRDVLSRYIADTQREDIRRIKRELQ